MGLIIRVFENIWYFIPIFVIILGFLSFFNGVNKNDLFDSMPVLITSYVVFIGFFTAIYPKKIIELDHEWLTITEDIKRKIPKLKNVIIRYQNQYSKIKIKKPKEMEQEIPNPIYLDKLMFPTKIIFQYFGIVIFYIFLILFYIFKNIISSYNIELFFVIYFVFLWIFITVIYQIIMKISAYHSQYYFMKVIIPEIILNPKFWADILESKRILNRVKMMDQKGVIQIPWYFKMLIFLFNIKTGG